MLLLCCRPLVFLLEALHAACRINQLLLAGEERVAVRANFHANQIAAESRAGLKGVPARAVHRHIVIIGMNIVFHVFDRSVAPVCTSQAIIGCVARRANF